METTVKKVVLPLYKGDTVTFKKGPVGKKVYTGKIVKYPDNKNISIQTDEEVFIVAKEFILSKVDVA